MATHQVIDTGWCDEHRSVVFEGSLRQCRDYLAAHGGDAHGYVRRVPAAESRRERAEAERSAARAALLASFGRAA